MGKITINRKDYIWSYIGSFVKLGVNIILLPIVLVYLSDDELGLWYVFGSLATLVALLDFGFAPALARNISYVWCGATSLKKEDVNIIDVKRETDFKYFKTLLKTCKMIYFLISSIALLLMLTVGSYYIYKIGSINAIYSWVIYSIAIFVNMHYGYFNSFLRGVGAIAESNKASLYSRLIQVACSALLLLLGYGLIGVSIAFLVSGIFLRVYSYTVFMKYDGIGNKLKEVEIGDVKEKVKDLFGIVWHNASKEGLITLSNYLSTQANTLICSSVLGLSSTGSYGLSVQFAAIISTLSSVPFQVNHPKLQEMSISGNFAEGKKIFSFTMSLYSIIFILLSIGLILCIPIIIWLKPTYSINTLMLVCILAYMFIYHFYHLFCSYISTFNILPYTKSFILTAILSVTTSFVFAKYFNIGIWALVLCPFIVSAAYNAWKWPMFILKEKLHISLVRFFSIGSSEVFKYVKKNK